MQAAFYKATRPGLPGIYNRLVRWCTNSKFSHCELIFSDGIAGSASFMDGGVRFKTIDLDLTRWTVIDLPDELEAAAREWFIAHNGKRYDLLGNLHFAIGPIRHDHRKWFCSEAIAAALGMDEPWRYDPGTLRSTLAYLTHPASAVFFRRENR